MQRPLIITASALCAVGNLVRNKLTGREVDCWRRVLGLGLRSDGAQFGLATFGLKLPAEGDAPANAQERCAASLAAFLHDELEARWALRTHRHHVERLKLSEADLVCAVFSPEGELSAIEPHLNPRSPAPPREAQANVHRALLAAHAATRDLPESLRPAELLRRASASGTPANPGQALYARRLCQAAFLSFEPMPADSRARFLPPDLRRRRALGGGLLNIVARLASRHVDLWFNIHHTGSDGAPMQEMISRLERALGAVPVTYPPDDPAPPPCLLPLQPSAADRPLSLVLDFVDCSPLVRWRARMNEQLRGTLGEPLPLAAALLWNLARQEEFAGRTFSTAVDVPPHGPRPRAVDLVAIRPADYLDRPNGLHNFARAYLQLLAAARTRSSKSYSTMRGMALLPPWLAALAIRTDPQRTRDTFGTVGLTMLRDARVFIAPMSDSAFDDGFLALGNLALPDERGTTVAAFTAKGLPEQVQTYPAALRRAMAACAREAI